MEKILTKYLRIFKKLRIDKSRGPAPHKPILLLSILQSFEVGQISSHQIFVTPELVALFRTNWSLLVNSNHDCRFSLPFYHLKSDGFWKLVPKPGFEVLMQFATSMRSFANLNAAIECAVLEKELFDLIKDLKSNRILQHFLLDEYFPGKDVEIDRSVGVQQQVFQNLKIKFMAEDFSDFREEVETLLKQKDEEEIFLRGSVFKREIPRLYDNTCCISGMRIDATLSVSMVDACHIVPFSVNFDDTVTNGFALCPNLHRAFDRGLIGINNEFRVVVSKSFQENESCFGIRRFNGQKIHFPIQKKYYPKLENFKWHFEHIFF